MLLQKIKSDPCKFVEKEEIGLGKFDKFELDSKIFWSILHPTSISQTGLRAVMTDDMEHCHILTLSKNVISGNGKMRCTGTRIPGDSTSRMYKFSVKKLAFPMSMRSPAQTKHRDESPIVPPALLKLA